MTTGDDHRSIEYRGEADGTHDDQCWSDGDELQ